MPRPRTLALILAGGEGKRMEALTQVRAKPSMPYAGIYRLIDFPLSNCVHSGLSDVWVIEQFQPHSINDHLANGRPWDLDRTYGGLRVLQPHTDTQEGGFHQGNADALYRNRRILRDFGADIILVLSADHIYKLDYAGVIDTHLQRKADITMVTTRMPIEDAGRYGNVQVDAQGKVTDFAYKPDPPQSETVTTEVFVYNARTLLDTLEELAAKGDDGKGEDEPALKDFGHELIPAFVEQGSAYAYALDGYWRDVGVIESYWESHMDLLSPEPVLNLDDPSWPILTYGFQRMPAHIHDTARIANSLVAPGCTILGRVERSVLSPGVVVEEGAIVRDAIVFENSIIRADARVERAIVDSQVEVGSGARVGAGGDGQPITLLGQRSRIGADQAVRAGDRVAPGDHIA
jgi:glucose-1-phosphate adenylyltransferase